jgi:hypothetical protein
MEHGQDNPHLPPHRLLLDTQDLLELVCLVLAILDQEKKEAANMDLMITDMDLTPTGPQDLDPLDLLLVEHLNLQDMQVALVLPAAEEGIV